MAIIKLCYGTLLPDPSTLLKQLSNTQEAKPENIDEVNSPVLNLNEKKKVMKSSLA
jgi:hypothetical protein